MYQSFYEKYSSYSLEQLRKMFINSVGEFVLWIQSFSFSLVAGNGQLLRQPTGQFGNGCISTP
ncbi:ClbS/DfsB family four-helix bundle protein [Anaerocolumna sp.]|uniref:ClbS/DfsB family four-helix bundle protein n=1 Tax=Anaerocolumna sp. TaxID=2041569 RepID=UPI003FA41BB1